MNSPAWWDSCFGPWRGGRLCPEFLQLHQWQSLPSTGSAASLGVSQSRGVPVHALPTCQGGAPSTTSSDIEIVAGRRTPAHRERVLGLFLTLSLTLALKKTIFNQLLPLPYTLVSWKLTSNICPQHFRLVLLSTASMLINNWLFRALNWREKDMPEVLPVPPSDCLSPAPVPHDTDPSEKPATQTGPFLSRFFESSWRGRKRAFHFFQY